MGARVDYPGFLQAWAGEAALLDERSDVDDSEFSMEQVAAAFLTRTLRRDPDPAQISRFVEAYLAEWNTGVIYPPGIAELVGALAGSFRLAVVTNTHKADLVPGHLSAM